MLRRRNLAVCRFDRTGKLPVDNLAACRSALTDMLVRVLLLRPSAAGRANEIRRGPGLHMGGIVAAALSPAARQITAALAARLHALPVGASGPVRVAPAGQVQFPWFTVPPVQVT